MMAYPYMGQAGGAGPGQTGSQGAPQWPQAVQYQLPAWQQPSARGAPLLPGVTRLAYSRG